MWWCEKLDGRLAAGAPNYYKLKESRLPYGVDYGHYMFALAQEIQAAPSLLYWLFRNPRVAIVCAFGQAHVPIFRLQGPFAAKNAEDTCAGELFAPITQRPLLVNFVFVIDFFLFAAINGSIAMLETRSGQAALLLAMFWTMTNRFG